MMSSIHTTPVVPADKDEPVPVGEQSLDNGETKPASTRKVRVRAGDAAVSAKRETTTVDAGKIMGSKPAASGATKTEIVLKKLRSARGATIAQLGEATGWQAHSVRGFLSAIIRRKLSLSLSSEVGKDGVRRYRIADSA